MVAGHYAAALITAAHKVKAPFWLLLLCSQIPEFLWLLLATLGIEPTLPASIFDATFANIEVDMRFSHNLVPGIIQGIITGICVFAFYRSTGVALWCSALVVIHVLCDYIVGFSHQIMWYSSPAIGLNSYRHMPYIAILIELAFALGCVAYFQIKRTDRPLGKSRLTWLYLLFAIGILVWMPAAKIPLRSWFGF
ncbi:MAG: hypothetical protein JNM27_05000 [Leptospirales bacterium]|nr:hypothetical protein [Leptospirales bacterium]